MNTQLPYGRIRLQRGSYATTSDSQRVALIRLIVEKNVGLQEAATKLDIKLSTAKSVIDLYEKTGRIRKSYCNDGLPSTKKLERMRESGLEKPEADEITDNLVKLIEELETKQKGLIED